MSFGARDVLILVLARVTGCKIATALRYARRLGLYPERVDCSQPSLPDAEMQGGRRSADLVEFATDDHEREPKRRNCHQEIQEEP